MISKSQLFFMAAAPILVSCASTSATRAPAQVFVLPTGHYAIDDKVASQEEIEDLVNDKDRMITIFICQGATAPQVAEFLNQIEGSRLTSTDVSLVQCAIDP